MKITIVALIATLALFSCGKKKEVEYKANYPDSLVEGSGLSCPLFSGTYICKDVDSDETKEYEIVHYKYQDGSRTIELNGTEYNTDGKIHDGVKVEKFTSRYVVDCSSNSREIFEGYGSGEAYRTSIFRDIAAPVAISQEFVSKDGKVKEDLTHRYACEFK